MTVSFLTKFGRPLLATALGLFVVTWGAAESEPTDEQAKERAPAFRTGGFTHGESGRGLAAFLVRSGARFTVGESISLSFGVIVTERADAQGALKVVRPYGASDPNNRSWFSVLGPDGRALKYRGGFPNHTRAGAKQVVDLWNGDFIGRTSDDEQLSFDFKRPGRYRIRWNYLPPRPEGVEDVWEGKLISNEIEIEIVE